MKALKSPNWGINHLKIPQVRKDFSLEGEICLSGKGIKIAIIDSGLDETNTEIYVNVKESFDFTKNTNKVMIDSRTDKHGTHIAGIIGSSNSKIGIAYDSELYIAKIYDDSGIENSKFLVPAIEWAICKEVDIISLSQVDFVCSSALHQSVRRAQKKGILVIAAVGNSDVNSNGMSVEYPAAFDETIGVSAFEKRTNKIVIYDAASTGQMVDIVAPGHNLITKANPNKPNDSIEGTSFATPFVAGVVALYLQRSGDKIKKDRNRLYLIKDKLIRSADPPPLSNDRVRRRFEWGFGVLNALTLFNQSFNPHYIIKDLINDRVSKLVQKELIEDSELLKKDFQCKDLNDIKDKVLSKIRAKI